MEISAQQKEILQSRATGTIKSRLQKIWTDELNVKSGLRSALEAKVSANSSNTDILGYISSHQPSDNPTVKRGKDESWTAILSAGADSETERGPDSVISIATELVGGADELQELAKKKTLETGSNTVTLTVPLSDNLGLEADIELLKGFDRDPNRYFPQNVKVFAPQVLKTPGLDTVSNPAADLVSEAAKNAVLTPVKY